MDMILYICCYSKQQTVVKQCFPRTVKMNHYYGQKISGHSAVWQRTWLGTRGSQVRILLLRPFSYVRVQLNGRAPAFQAGCEGSIPFTRSTYTCDCIQYAPIQRQCLCDGLFYYVWVIGYDCNYIWFSSSVGQSNGLLSRGSGVRIPPGSPNQHFVSTRCFCFCL